MLFSAAMFDKFLSVACNSVCCL